MHFHPIKCMTPSTLSQGDPSEQAVACHHEAAAVPRRVTGCTPRCQSQLVSHTSDRVHTGLGRCRCIRCLEPRQTSRTRSASSWPTACCSDAQMFSVLAKKCIIGKCQGADESVTWQAQRLQLPMACRVPARNANDCDMPSMALLQGRPCRGVMHHPARTVYKPRHMLLDINSSNSKKHHRGFGGLLTLLTQHCCQ